MVIATRRAGCAGEVAAWSSVTPRTIVSTLFHMALHYR